MIKVIFKWQESYTSSEEEIFEFKEGTTDEEINNAYDEWLGELIGNRMSWDYIED